MAEPSKSPSMTLNSARAKATAPPPAAGKKPRRNKDKSTEEKKKTEPDEGSSTPQTSSLSSLSTPHWHTLATPITAQYSPYSSNKVAEKVEIEKGSGVFIFPSGMRYEGEWQKFDGVVKRQGLGVLAAVHPVENEAEQPSNEGGGLGVGVSEIGEVVEWIYEGEWKEDMMHGRGVFRFPSGAVFDGEWENNKYMGTGRYTFPDGSQYEGAFYDNKIHGQGLFVDTKSEVWKGKFYNNNGPGLVVNYS